MSATDDITQPERQTRKPLLCLHIGSGKTGSTSIQEFLHANRERLRRAGWLVPETAGVTRHVNILNLTHPPDIVEKHQLSGNLPQAARIVGRGRFIEAFEKELAASDSANVILSEESMALRYSPEQVATLAAYLEPRFGAIHIICYLRRQDLHLLSNYQEQVKSYYAGTFTEFAKPAAHYDYHARMRLWAQHFGHENISVVPFEKDQFHGADLIEDFRHRLGVPDSEGLTRTDETHNVGLDAFQLEYLRIANARYLTEPPTPDFESLAKLRQAILSHPAEHPVKPALSRADAETILAAYEDTNRLVAREFLHRPNGDLFREPIEEPEFAFGADTTLQKAREIFARYEA